MVNMNENKKQSIGITLMLCCAMFMCFGQFVWKYYGGPISLLAGFVIYGIGAMMMLAAYRFGRLSVLQPINSISYVFAALVGALVFDEAVNGIRIFGIVVIIVGIVLLAGGEEKRIE
jgi:undecaprenyl phosphate-alpha-L-ara4N flippase subunit ArnE